MYMFLAVSLAVFGWRIMYLVSVNNVKVSHPYLGSPKVVYHSSFILDSVLEKQVANSDLDDDPLRRL